MRTIEEHKKELSEIREQHNMIIDVEVAYKFKPYQNKGRASTFTTRLLETREWA
jgi:hypothetical protein